jgi:hypothetical protein
LDDAAPTALTAWIRAVNSREIEIAGNAFVRLNVGGSTLDMKAAGNWTVPNGFGFAIAGGSRCDFNTNANGDMFVHARNTLQLDSLGANQTARITCTFTNTIGDTPTHVITAAGMAINSGTNPSAGLEVFGLASAKTAIFRANATTPGNLSEWQASGGTPFNVMSGSTGHWGIGGSSTSAAYRMWVQPSATVAGIYYECTSSQSQTAFNCLNSTTSASTTIGPASIAMISPADSFAHFSIGTSGSAFYMYFDGTGTFNWANGASSRDTFFGRNAGATGGVTVGGTGTGAVVFRANGPSGLTANIMDLAVNGTNKAVFPRTAISGSAGVHPTTP